MARTLQALQQEVPLDLEPLNGSLYGSTTSSTNFAPHYTALVNRAAQGIHDLGNKFHIASSNFEVTETEVENSMRITSSVPGAK